MATMLSHYHFATTNKHKLREIKLAGFDIEAKPSVVDAPEPMASMREIVIDKSRRAGAMSIVEDTAFFIDGFPDAGVTIKSFEAHRRMHEAIGASAAYQVAMAINDGTFIFIVERMLQGKVVPETDLSDEKHAYNGYAFSRFFQPIGFRTTYDATKTEFALATSPRIKCMRAIETLLVARQNYKRFDALTKTGGKEHSAEDEIAYIMHRVDASYAPADGPLWRGDFQKRCGPR